MAKHKNRNEYVYNLALDWVRWLDTRRFFGPPEQKNILARLQGGGKSGGEPDGVMSAEVAAFNLAVCGLEIGYFIPFIAIYCEYRPKPVKVMAYELGIQPPAFYDRAEKAAADVRRVTQKLTEMHKMMAAEVSDL